MNCPLLLRKGLVGCAPLSPPYGPFHGLRVSRRDVRSCFHLTFRFQGLDLFAIFVLFGLILVSTFTVTVIMSRNMFAHFLGATPGPGDLIRRQQGWRNPPLISGLCGYNVVLTMLFHYAVAN